MSYCYVTLVLLCCQVLTGQLNDYLSKAAQDQENSEGELQAIIAPHAGFR